MVQSCEEEVITAGLIILIGDGWQGGVSYFHNLLSCYQQHSDPELKLAVFSSRPEQFARYECDAIEVHSWPGLPQRNLWTVPRRAVRRFLEIDPVLIGLLKRRRVDLLSHVFPDELDSLGRRADVPALPWMPDFQHRRLPRFFTEPECADRDAFTARSGQWGNLLLSSRSAEADFRRFYPDLASVRTHILRFSCASVIDQVSLSRKELEARFPIQEPFFFLPNQFWQHKNHAVVVEALRRTHGDIRVICTGRMDDYRSPGYISSLMETVKKAGLEERFVCLGTVPYPVMVSLMHHSIAVLQPSLFEGWSTTVEESKAMRKRIILSNIDVHLEQAPERGIYFCPNSAEQLAETLRQVKREFDPLVEEEFVEQRQQNRESTEKEWIGQYGRIVKRVCGAEL